MCRNVSKCGLVLHLKIIENKKGSEIDEGQAIIEDCTLQNKVFTGDAWHCQKKTISLIAKSKNDYVITVKIIVMDEKYQEK